MNAISRIAAVVLSISACCTSVKAESCSETIQSEGAIAMVGENGALVLRMAVSGPRTEYTCECKADAVSRGTCSPYYDGTNVGCTSPDCSDCDLKSSTVKSTFGVEAVEVSCMAQYSAEQDTGFAERKTEIESYLAERGVDVPANIGDEIEAPEGYVIQAEEVGGRLLANIVAESDLDEAERAAGGGGGKAKCYCKDDGKCHWEGIVCSSNGFPDSCNTCAISLKSKLAVHHHEHASHQEHEPHHRRMVRSNSK